MPDDDAPLSDPDLEAGRQRLLAAGIVPRPDLAPPPDPRAVTAVERDAYLRGKRLVSYLQGALAWLDEHIEDEDAEADAQRAEILRTITAMWVVKEGEPGERGADNQRRNRVIYALERAGQRLADGDAIGEARLVARETIRASDHDLADKLRPERHLVETGPGSLYERLGAEREAFGRNLEQQRKTRLAAGDDPETVRAFVSNERDRWVQHEHDVLNNPEPRELLLAAAVEAWGAHAAEPGTSVPKWEPTRALLVYLLGADGMPGVKALRDNWTAWKSARPQLSEETKKPRKKGPKTGPKRGGAL